MRNLNFYHRCKKKLSLACDQSLGSFDSWGIIYTPATTRGVSFCVWIYSSLANTIYHYLARERVGRDAGAEGERIICHTAGATEDNQSSFGRHTHIHALSNQLALIWSDSLSRALFVFFLSLSPLSLSLNNRICSCNYFSLS